MKVKMTYQMAYSIATDTANRCMRRRGNLHWERGCGTKRERELFDLAVRMVIQKLTYSGGKIWWDKVMPEVPK
jgi:hypothetical protein